MSWYVLDAVDRAVERTRKCLIEPFDIWKWLKLTIITFFVGSGGGFNGGGNGGSYGGSDTDFSQIPSGITEIMDSIHNFFSSYSVVAIVVGIILVIALFVLVMSILRSIMEFVFVESLVYNDVQIWKYLKKYLRKGLSLFFLRILLDIGVLLIFILAALSLLSLAGVSISDIANPDSIDAGAMLFLVPFMIFSLIAILLVVAIIMAIINSFINLAIPVSMYSDCSIFSGISRVLGQFRHEWEQILVYWIGRLILIIAVGIAVAIVGLIAVVLVLLLLGIVDFILYYIFSALLSDTTVWLLLIPILIIEFIMFIFALVLVGMPAKVFMKYHMLSFLQKWYPVDIPMFDVHHSMYRIGNGNMVGEVDSAGLSED